MTDPLSRSRSRSQQVIGNTPDLDATIPAQGMLKLASQLGSVFALDLPGGRLVVVSGQELVDKLCDEPGSNKKLYAPLQRVREYLSDSGQPGVAAWTAEHGRLATASAWWDRERSCPWTWYGGRS